MIIGQELEMALGLPIEIDSFLDGLPRKCYPYKIIDLYKANTYLSFFDHKDMAGNMQDENKTIAMICFLAESFKDTDIEELLKNINNELFPEIICDMKFVNGIIDNDGEKDLDKSKESIEWSTSTSAIITYTSSTYEDIKNMTLTQFTTLLGFIGKKINWEYKSGILDLAKDPSDFIGQDEHPLSSKNGSKAKKHMTMSDVMGLSES